MPSSPLWKKIDKGILVNKFVHQKTMKDSCSSSVSMLRDDTNYPQGEQTPDYRLISNPFDPPTSVHLKQRLASFSIFNEVSFILI
jgi:hypothetical protein